MGWEIGAAMQVDRLDPLPAALYRFTGTPGHQRPPSRVISHPMPLHTAIQKKPLRLDDEVQFIRSWLEKPLSTGAVMPSSKVLARTMASYVDPQAQGPVIELGPG